MLPCITEMVDALFQIGAEQRTRAVRQAVRDGTIPRLKEQLDRLKEAPHDHESTADAT